MMVTMRVTSIDWSRLQLLWLTLLDHMTIYIYIIYVPLWVTLIINDYKLNLPLEKMIWVLYYLVKNEYLHVFNDYQLKVKTSISIKFRVTLFGLTYHLKSYDLSLPPSILFLRKLCYSRIFIFTQTSYDLLTKLYGRYMVFFKIFQWQNYNS